MFAYGENIVHLFDKIEYDKINYRVSVKSSYFQRLKVVKKYCELEWISQCEHTGHVETVVKLIKK